MNERLSKLIRLFSVIEGHKIDEQYVVRGTSLRKLAETNGGGYQRVLKWAEGKVNPKVAKMEGVVVEEIDPNYERMKDFFRKCLALYKERNAKYGDSWTVMTPHTTANLIEMKAQRAREMGDTNAKSNDEAYDMANYAAMLYLKLNENEKI